MGDVRDFVEEYGITARAEETDYSDMIPGGTKWSVQLRRPVHTSEARRGYRSITVPFHTGSGITDFGENETEDAAMVLSSLQSDAQTAENTGDAEELADEFGWDWWEPDQRREAQRVFRGVNSVKIKLEPFLGDELYEELLWETEGL
jgi:hypothetical protein